MKNEVIDIFNGIDIYIRKVTYTYLKSLCQTKLYVVVNL